jgi:hypothetical protein
MVVNRGSVHAVAPPRAQEGNNFASRFMLPSHCKITKKDDFWEWRRNDGSFDMVPKPSLADSRRYGSKGLRSAAGVDQEIEQVSQNRKVQVNTGKSMIWL